MSRPCKRCSAVGKCDTCIDIKHKKRGRPKLADGLKKPIKNKSVMAPPLTPLNNFVSLLPMTAPGLAACSFSMTQPNNKNKLPTNVEKVLPPSEMMTVSVIFHTHIHINIKFKGKKCLIYIFRYFYLWIYVVHAYQMKRLNF